MSTTSVVALSGDVRLLRTLKTVLPTLNMRVIAPPAPVPSADAASPLEIRLALIDADYPDTAAVLKWLEPDRRIPVILMWDGGTAGPRSLRGAAAILSKPLDPNKLRAAIELVVPDWEQPLDREPHLAEILDFLGEEKPTAESPSRQDPEGRSTGPATEEEIDRLLGPALAEIGISAKWTEPPNPPLRQSAPEQKAPATLPAPLRMPEPAAEARDIPLSTPKILPGEPMPEDAECLFVPVGPTLNEKKARLKRVFLGSGLSVIVLVGSVYLGFGRRSVKPDPAAAMPAAARMIEQASARGNAPSALGDKISYERTTPGRASLEAQNTPADKPDRTIIPGPQPDPSLSEKEKPAPGEALVTVIPIAEPSTPPPGAGSNVLPKNEPPEKNDPAAKIKSEPIPDIAKNAPETAPRPEPVKIGELVELAAVDKLPVLLKSADPVYPPLAYRNRVQAKVTLSVLISEKGAVIDAKPSGDSTVEPGFAASALKAVRLWIYSPALKDGVPVKVWKTVVIDFRFR